jgi:anti-sigma factor RsiW
MKTNCPTPNCPTEDILLDYTAGRLNRTQTALFDKHAGHCARCAALRMSQAAVWQSLDEWKPAPVSDGFNRELWRRIDADAHKSSWTQELAAVLQFSFWKRLAPLAVAMALIVTGYMYDHAGTQTGKLQPDSGASIVVTASEADQLDRALDDIQLLDEVDASATAPAKPASSVM